MSSYNLLDADPRLIIDSEEIQYFEPDISIICSIIYLLIIAHQTWYIGTSSIPSIDIFMSSRASGNRVCKVLHIESCCSDIKL